LITILATVVVLGVLIFVHELGHFVTAKLVDIEVPRFSIGLGPKAWGFKRGETEYVISWLPLGGYVKMAGMEELEAIEGGSDGTKDRDAEAGRRTPGPRDFESKSLPARMLVISAGVIMNIVFAVVVFASIAMIWGLPLPLKPILGGVSEESLPTEARAFLDVPAGSRIIAVGDRAVDNWQQVERDIATAPGGSELTIRFEHAKPITFQVPKKDSLRAAVVASLAPEQHIVPLIGLVKSGSPADRAGMKTGDRVLDADGAPVTSWLDFVNVVEHQPGRPVPLVVRRGGERVTLTVVPDSVPVPAAPGRFVGRIGVGVSQAATGNVPRARKGPIEAAGYGLAQTWYVTRMIGHFIGGLFTGSASPRDVGGPILIAQLSHRMIEMGLEAFLNFMALFSVNLAVLNLLPIPILDGGQLLFLVLEAVRGRSLSYEQRMRLSQVGLVIVVAIMVWALANDVMRLFGM
jgi:regulator of sigma E protease